MGKHFKVNDNMFYVEDPNAKKNSFIGKAPEGGSLPGYEDSYALLPRPIWEGHDNVIACHDFAWKTAFRNLRKAKGEAGFVSDFIDTAFNGYLFMWDSSFIVMFGKYGERAFNFQKTLDNFYSHQHKDGFICREICEDEDGEQFTRDDPVSTGPNILPLAEWEYYLSTGDADRLSRVFDPLMGYHRWLRLNRSWQDGSYYSCGLACGMDNQPRQPKGYHHGFSHGHMSWIDICAEQYLSADILVKMSEALCREGETAELAEEMKLLYDTVNNKMWSEKDGYYYDRFRDGTLSGVKTVGAYWALLAGLVPDGRIDRFVSHLDDPDEFRRHDRVPSLSADHPDYQEYGGYWLGGVWSPTNYMILRGLNKYGYDKLAYEIACDHLENVVEVFEKTGTLYENYAPELAAPGNPAKPDFVGWTGLSPISMLYEFVLGIKPRAGERRIVWNVNRTERHGICNYPFADVVLDLVCEKRNSPDEKPTVRASIIPTAGSAAKPSPVEIEIVWNGGREKIEAGIG